MVEMIENGSEDVEEKERVDVCAVVVEMVKLEGELKKVIEVDDMIEEEEVELKAGEEGVKGKVEGEVEREGLGGETFPVVDVRPAPPVGRQLSSH